MAGGLRKAGYPKDKVDNSFTLLKELAELDLINLVPVSRDIGLAKDLIAEPP